MHSVLARWIQRRTGDRLRAEGWFVVALVGLGLALLTAQYAGWMLLHPTLQADPRGPVALAFWGAQVVLLVGAALLALVGVRPAIEVVWDDAQLAIQQGTRHLTVPAEAIDEAAVIPARLYHRHYRRYAATQVFVNDLGEEVVVLHTTTGPIILGLPPSARRPFLDALTRELPAVSAPADVLGAA